MVDYMGACLKCCITPALLPAYMAVCAVPKEKVDCSITKNSTAGKVFGQKRNKRVQGFVEISHYVGEKLFVQFFYVIKLCPQ